MKPGNTPSEPVWLLASAALQRPVPVSKPYPHIHDRTVPAERTVSGNAPVTFWRRDCAACDWKPGRGR
jgi:hypothetical protein